MSAPAQSQDAALFYLRRRQQTEEWAALARRRPRAGGTAHSGGSSSRSRPSPRRSVGRWEVKDLRGCAWPAILVCLPGWRTKSVRLGVGVRWDRRQLLVPHDNQWAWVGAYVDGAPNRVSAAVSDRLALLADQHDLFSKPPWPIWRFVSPPARPLDPTEYAELVLHEVRELWPTVAREVGDALQRRTARNVATLADGPVA